MRKFFVKLAVFCALSLLFLSATNFRAWGNEGHLIFCLTNSPDAFEAPDQIDPPAVFARRVIEQMTGRTTVAITVHYDKTGGILDRTTNEIPTQPGAAPLWTDNQKQKVIETIDSVISREEFSALPLRRQQDIINTIRTEVRVIPESIEGQSLSDEDFDVKLKHLSLVLRRLKNIPVVSVENPESIAHQLSKLVNILADDAMQRGGKAVSLDPDMRNRTLWLLEDEITILARDTTTPCLKRALPDTVFQELKSNLQNSLKSTSATNSNLRLQTAIEDNSTNRSSEIEQRNNNIAAQLANEEFMRFGKIIIDPYIGYARTNDLKNVDFRGGISETERREDGKRMKAYMDREIERAKVSEKTQLEKFKLDNMKRQSEASQAFGIPPGKHGRAAMMAIFVAANAGLITLLIRFRKKVA